VSLEKRKQQEEATNDLLVFLCNFVLYRFDDDGREGIMKTDAALFIERTTGFDTNEFSLNGCKVLVSDENGLCHMSISRPDRNPSWEEIKEARNKDLFRSGGLK
jgi:hypothetical protein